MKISQDLLSAMIAKISEKREAKLNKNYVEQKPSADVIKKAKKYSSLLQQIPAEDRRKIFGSWRSKSYTPEAILKDIFTAPEKKKVDKNAIRNEIVLYAATCRRTEEVIAKFKAEME